MKTRFEIFLDVRNIKDFENLHLKEKEDLGLLFLMQQTDRTKTVREKEILELLK